MIDYPVLVDLTPVAYMGSVFFWYWLSIFAVLFVGFIPTLLVVSSLLRAFGSIIKRAW